MDDPRGFLISKKCTVCVVYSQSDKGIKRKYPDTEVLNVKNFSDTTRVGENEWVLLYKIVGCHCWPNLNSLRRAV